MPVILKNLLPLSAWLLLPALACAQNGSTAGALELYPTFNSIGARLTYAGDADSNAIAHLEWRPLGGGVWTRGVDMTRISNSRWAGSMFWLHPDSPYEVQAVIEDPDGGSSASGTIRTRREPSPIRTGRRWWVALNGSDAAAGDSLTPLATLQAAADRANPGDEIRVRPGLYYQALDVNRAGTEAALIHIVADAPGVILDGSDPALLHRSDWQSEGGGIFSLPFGTQTRLVCADSLERLYHQDSLAALQSNHNGISQGWTIQKGRLYVKLEDQSSPTGHVMHIARFDIGVLLDQSDWHVSGLEIRYFGTTSSELVPPASGILILNANCCWITNCHVHTNGGKEIYLRGSSADNLIEHNLLRDPRIGTWPRTAGKGHQEELQSVSNRGGRGNVIRFNTCTGTFDGIDTTNDNGDENGAADMDAHDNLITQIADDALEPEAIAGINVRLWHNRIDTVFDGCSISPNYQGPEYVLYNTITNFSFTAFKLSISSNGSTWYCHNTCWTSIAGKSSVHSSGPYSKKHFRNNILFGSGTYAVDDDRGESQIGNDFDGDLLFTPGSPFVFRWRSVNYTSLSALRAATGFEQNGLAGDPLFVSTAAGNFALQAGSPAIDAGIRLAGINDRFNGTTPDVGANEFGPALSVAPGVTQEGAWLASPWPNPARGEISVRFSLPRSERMSLVIVDLSGRLVTRLASGVMDAGEHQAHWDGRGARGALVPSGLYFVRLATPEQSRVVRLVTLH